MEQQEIQNQLTVKQTQLNLTNDADQRKKILKQLNILRLKLEIEQIRQRIENLHNS